MCFGAFTPSHQHLIVPQIQSRIHLSIRNAQCREIVNSFYSQKNVDVHYRANNSWMLQEENKYQKKCFKMSCLKNDIEAKPLV